MSINAKIGKYCSRRKFNCNKFSGNEGTQTTASSFSSLPLKRKTSLFANKHFPKKTTNSSLINPKRVDHVDEDSGFCDDFSNNNSVGKSHSSIMNFLLHMELKLSSLSPFLNFLQITISEEYSKNLVKNPLS